MDLSSTSTTSVTNPSTIPAVSSGTTNTNGAVNPVQGFADSGTPQPQPHQPGYSSPNRPLKKSSTTCTTCRARKVRCNGVRPMCSNCQRLGFPCSYDDDASDPAAAAAAWSVALPRRRVKQACLSCHSRKARCSGHMPACERCRAQGIECVYRPTKRARISNKSLSGGRNSPQSHDEDHRDDGHNDSDGFIDGTGATTPNFTNDMYDLSHAQPFQGIISLANHEYSPCPDESFDALIGRTFEKFFRHVHHIPMYSFLHRASLMEQYHAGKVERPLLLALVGITSCLTDMGSGMRAYGSRCIDEAEGLILSDYSRPSTIKVQALVLMIKQRILSNRFPSAFMLIGIASRFAAALRLNYESPNICFLAQESRRRLMWALYCIDSGISGGHRDFSLWRAERIFVGLPCNERNFEFDLPQDTEKLIPEPNQPQSAQAEDIGSLALHIRIQHIRHKISEFTKDALVSRSVHPGDLQTRVLSLHRELEDFAAHLPASFQFSENSLRLRAYSPRICVFVMIHVWWRQCHCDLYRLGLIGLREALPKSTLEKFDESFIEHCQRQCVDHAMAMASIFASMQKLNAKPVADLDLAICAYQCARMLKYAYHANSGKLNLSPESVMEQFKVCLQAIKECCVGIAAAGIRTDLEKLIGHGLGPRVMPSQITPPPDINRNINSGGFGNSVPRQTTMFKDMDVSDDAVMTSTPTSATTVASDTFPPAAPTAQMTIPPAMMATDAWTPTTGSAPDTHDVMPDVQHEDFSAGNPPAPSSGGQSELNNAFEGAMDGLGLDNGLDYAMGIDMNMWTPGNGEWSVGGEFMTGTGVGV